MNMNLYDIMLQATKDGGGGSSGGAASYYGGGSGESKFDNDQG